MKFSGRMSRQFFFILLEDQPLKGDERDLERFSGTLGVDASHMLSRVEWLRL